MYLHGCNQSAIRARAEQLFVLCLFFRDGIWQRSSTSPPSVAKVDGLPPAPSAGGEEEAVTRYTGWPSRLPRTGCYLNGDPHASPCEAQ
eukprot:3683143-Pyramimonas_sp.AAC.1